MKWPFFSKKHLASSTGVEKIGSRMVRIESIDFFGPYAESPDSKYLIACQDSDLSQGVGGYRLEGNGRFVLVESGRVLFLKECQRPNDGKVANNGTIIVCDWLFGDELGSELLAYDVNGKELLRHRFTANAYNNGISADGQFAIVQLCNSATDDGGKLYLFDVNKRTILCGFIPEIGWASSYEFDPSGKILMLYYRNGRSYRYSFDGEFLDFALYQAERVEDASPSELVLIVQEKLKDPDSADVFSLLALLERAYSKDLSKYPDYLALAHRLRGELYESAGETRRALEAYRDALVLNPKIGVKKRILKLERQFAKENQIKSKTKPATSQLNETQVVSAPEVQALLYAFTLRAFIGGYVKKIPFEHSKTQDIMSILESESLSQDELARLPAASQRVIYELFTQYIMFVSLNPQLLFPPGFLRDSNENQLGTLLLAYMREHEWPFPQLLRSY